MSIKGKQSVAQAQAHAQQTIPNYSPESMTANQAQELHQNMNYLLEADNCNDFRIRQLEYQLHAKKIDDQTIYPDHVIETPNGMTIHLGSSSKFMWATNFRFLGAVMMVFPKPFEKEAYYRIDLSLVNENQAVSILLADKELSDYKTFNKILFKHRCCVFSTKGKADKKTVLSLLADFIMQNTAIKVLIMPVLAGWTPEELCALGVKNEYAGINIHDEMLTKFNINKKRLALIEKPDIAAIRGFEDMFTDKKIYMFLIAWHIYGIVKSKLPDGIKSSLKKILNLKGNENLSQEIALFVFKIFNRDNMVCDLTKRDGFAEIDEALLLARDETVIVSDFDKVATRNEKNNTIQRLQYLESVICNEAPIRGHKSTAGCVLISNSACDVIAPTNLIQIHIDNRVVNEEALILWKLSAGNFHDLNSVLIRHINLVYQSFYDDITERYRTKVNSSELGGVFKSGETKGAFIVLSYMLKIYRDAITSLDESTVLDVDYCDKCIMEVLLANEDYQSGEIDSSEENILYVFKEALYRFVESKLCNIAEIGFDDKIDITKPTIYHDDKYFYIKEKVFKESICPLMSKTVSGTKTLNALKSKGVLLTNNGRGLTSKAIINGEREHYIKISRTFTDVRGEISYFD